MKKKLLKDVERVSKELREESGNSNVKAKSGRGGKKRWSPDPNNGESSKKIWTSKGLLTEILNDPHSFSRMKRARIKFWGL